MSNDTAATVKLSLAHEYVTCFYVRSENNFKFIGLVYDTNILKSYEVYIRRGNSRSFWFNYLENREKLADCKRDFILRFMLLILQYLPLRYIFRCTG